MVKINKSVKILATWKAQKPKWQTKQADTILLILFVYKPMMRFESYAEVAHDPDLSEAKSQNLVPNLNNK